MTRSILPAAVAAVFALSLAPQLSAQTVGGDPNREEEPSPAEAMEGEPRYTVQDAMTAMRAGIENPDVAFENIDSDLDLVVVRLSELGSEEELAELDAQLTESAEEFVDYHRQIAENAQVSRGVEEAGYTTEDVIALWQGDEQIVLIVNDDSGEE